MMITASFAFTYQLTIQTLYVEKLDPLSEKRISSSAQSKERRWKNLRRLSAADRTVKVAVNNGRAGITVVAAAPLRI